MPPPSLILTPTKRTSFSEDRKPGRKLGSDRVIGDRILSQRSRNVIPRKSKSHQQGTDKKGVAYYFSCMSGEKLKKSPRISPEKESENI